MIKNDDGLRLCPKCHKFRMFLTDKEHKGKPGFKNIWMCKPCGIRVKGG